MRRKSHVSFLGEDATVTSRPYPTNGTRYGVAFVNWATMDDKPPANRKGPPRSETEVEQGKPIGLPVTAGEPQGTLLALWVKESGESERPPVMDGIRAETLPDVIHGERTLTNRYTRKGR
jgi:hypothetical protein